MFGLKNMPDDKVVNLLNNSLKGLTANATVFSKLPIDLPTYQAAIDAYVAARPAADDGSRTAISHKNKLRDAAIKMYVELAHYVESNCNDDMTTFLLSGFQPATSTKAAPQPLTVPSITSAIPGPKTGEMKIKTNSDPKTIAQEVHYGAVPAGGGTPATWLSEPIPSKRGVVITGLTPGTTYVFQVRALGRLGYTNFSDPVSRIAI